MRRETEKRENESRPQHFHLQRGRQLCEVDQLGPLPQETAHARVQRTQNGCCSTLVQQFFEVRLQFEEVPRVQCEEIRCCRVWVSLYTYYDTKEMRLVRSME